MCVLKYSKTNPLLQIWHIFEKAFWFDPLDFYFVSYRQLGVQSQQVFFFFFTCLVYKIKFMLGHISSVKKKKELLPSVGFSNVSTISTSLCLQILLHAEELFSASFVFILIHFTHSLSAEHLFGQLCVRKKKENYY